MIKRYEYPRVSPESVGIPSEAIWRMIEMLEQVTEMHGIMVMRHGKVCAEGWWDPYGPGVRHGLQSLTKTYAATAVGIAYTEGKLRLDERITDIFAEYLPETVSDNLKKMTIYDVLTMSCGMEYCTLGGKDWIKKFFSTPVVHAPGTKFYYNTAGSSMLGEIIMKKTGYSLHTYLREKLFLKLGIDDKNIEWIRTPDGHEVGGGGMLATTEDNLRLMDLYLRGGIWQGERILSEDFVEMATTKRIETEEAQQNGPLAIDHNLGYGFQIWMCQPKGAYRSDGAFGQYSIVFPDLDMIISLNETGEKTDDGTQKPLDMIYETLLPHIRNKPLDENEKAYRKLRQRLRTLSLEHPVYQPYSSLKELISGVKYMQEKGRVFFYHSDYCCLSGKDITSGITELSFAFGTNECVIHYTEGQEEKVITAAMDGTRRLNILENRNSVFHKLYANAYWKEENTLCLQCRWIESCYEHTLFFRFTDPIVVITAEDNALLGTNTPGEARFVRV